MLVSPPPKKKVYKLLLYMTAKNNQSAPLIADPTQCNLTSMKNSPFKQKDYGHNLQTFFLAEQHFLCQHISLAHLVLMINLHSVADRKLTVL